MAGPSWYQLLAGVRKRAREQSAQGPSPMQSAPSAQKIDQGEWYDASSSEESSPAKKGYGANGIADPDVCAFAPEQMAEYLPYMPCLFSKDLPPCGPHVQVAYENINNRLRMRWLASRGQESVADICRTIKEDLLNQKILQPVGHRGIFKQRKPWRSEIVFQYELRWIEYFIREAEAPEPMTESEIASRAKEHPIPKELGLHCDRQDVLRMWDAWHEKKRAKSPAVPDMGEEVSQNAASQYGMDNNIDRERGDLGVSIGSLEIANVQPTAEKEEHAQDELRAGSNEWSQGDHD